MVSVLPPTVACAVRTVAAALWLTEGGLLACELVAAAAVMPPPMAAAAARLMLAMMILGCRIVLAPCGIDDALSTNTISRRRRFTDRGHFCLGEGPDLVPGDGFLLQQGDRELGEGLPMAGEQVPGAGF